MTLFIELLDESRLRVCNAESATVLSDAELPAYLQKQIPSNDIVLLDPLHIQSKTFERPVKDKKVLSQVIAADMADYLLHDSSAYHFTQQTINGVMWVSWIEKSRLQLLKRRFASIQPRIKALVSAPLLAALALVNKNEAQTLWIFEHAPLVYALCNGQTTVLRAEHADSWLASQSTTAHTLSLAKSTNYRKVFTTNVLKQLPNLWQPAIQPTQATLPYRRWAILSVITMALWGVNRYMDYQQAKAQNNAVFSAQQALLRQLFPKAGSETSGDPYGRMMAEYQRLANSPASQWQTVQQLLRNTPLTVNQLSIDKEKQRLVLGTAIDEALLQTLTHADFQVTRTTTETIITWKN